MDLLLYLAAALAWGCLGASLLRNPGWHQDRVRRALNGHWLTRGSSVRRTLVGSALYRPYLRAVGALMVVLAGLGVLGALGEMVRRSIHGAP